MSSSGKKWGLFKSKNKQKASNAEASKAEPEAPDGSVRLVYTAHKSFFLFTEKKKPTFRPAYIHRCLNHAKCILFDLRDRIRV